MNSQFIDHINQHLKKLFDNYSGSKLHGLAQSVIRGSELLPCTVTNDGEGKYIGIDNTLPVQLYHKAVNLTTLVLNNGFGDDAGEYRNTYTNVMVVYLNRKKTNLLPDELFLYIQANFPEYLKIDPYLAIILRITSVILSTQTVINSEYQNSNFVLGPEHNLFAVNYTIESVFNKHCFEKCPTC